MNATDPERADHGAEGGQTAELPQQELFAKVLGRILEDNDVLLETNASAVPLTVLEGLTLEIDQDEWDRLRKTRSLHWLHEKMGQDEDSAWKAVSRGDLRWVRVLGLPRFPAWQFRRGGDTAREIFDEINSEIPIWWDAADIQMFMDTPHPQLGVRMSFDVSPADWLQHGLRPSAVASVLRKYSSDLAQEL